MRTSHLPAEATVTEIIEGPIAAVDRVYAFDKIRGICRRAPVAVRRARSRLTVQPHPSGSWPASAECTLMLEDGLIVCAGVVGNSVRGAIDALTVRLRRRIGDIGDEPLPQRIEISPANASSSVALTSARTVSVQSPGIGRSTPDPM
jgi:hypothetical protein